MSVALVMSFCLVLEKGGEVMPHPGLMLSRGTGQRDLGFQGHKAGAQELKSVSPSSPHASGPEVYRKHPHRNSKASAFRTQLSHL